MKLRTLLCWILLLRDCVDGDTGNIFTNYLTAESLFTSTSVLREVAENEYRSIRKLEALQHSMAHLAKVSRMYSDEFLKHNFNNSDCVLKELSGEQERECSEQVKDSMLHPVNAYLMLKRTFLLHKEIRPLLEDTFKQMKNAMDLFSHSEESGLVPKVGDVIGAADSLHRLTAFYGLDVDALTRGVLEGTFDGTRLVEGKEKSGNELESDDFDILAKVAAAQENKVQEEIWTKQMLKSNNTSCDDCSSEGSTEDDRSNEKKKKRPIEDLFGADGYRRSLNDFDEEYNKEVISSLCQGHQLQNAKVTSKLKCYLETHQAPYLLLMPLKVEVLYEVPKIVLFRDFFTPKQCDYFKKKSIFFLETSKVTYNKARKIDSSRMCSSTTIGKDIRSDSEVLNEEELNNYTDEDEFLTNCNKKIGLTTQLRVNTPFAAQGYSVINYGIGGYFNFHHDSRGTVMNGGRISTLMVYLSDVEAGGNTVFPFLGVSSVPTAGSALYWYSRDTKGAHNLLTSHVACPVLYGDKWIVTKWIYMNEQFRTQPCDLDQEKML